MSKKSVQSTARKYFTLLLIPVYLNLVNACAIHYKDVDNVTADPVNSPVSEKVQYQIKMPPVFSSNGDDAIVDVFTASEMFAHAERYYGDDIPSEGVFIMVETKYKAPAMPAVVFGYASVATLTLLPAWSNEDGFDVYFHVYQDGVLQKTLYYETRRFIAMWIVLLPLIWVNLFTSGEYDAFEAIAGEFIHDVRPYINASTT